MTVSIVKLNGDLDFSRKAQIEATLAEADSADIAIVDLSEVTYIDSSCLSSLAALKKRMRDNGTAAILRIAGANESLRRIFEICGLDKSFEMCASLEQAQNGAFPLSQA